MLIIKCLDIDPSLFFSRLALEWKINLGALAMPFTTEANLDSLPKSPAPCAPGKMYAALLAAGATITG
jgi:hypothetical protein